MSDQLFTEEREKLVSVLKTIITQLIEDKQNHENSKSEWLQSVLAADIVGLEEARDHVCKALAILEKLDEETEE